MQSRCLLNLQISPFIFVKHNDFLVKLKNKHRYIDDDGNLTVPPKIRKVSCWFLQLTSLNLEVLPEGLQKLDCSNNKLTSLNLGVLPEGIQVLWCASNKLTSLVVPEGVQELDCSDNKLIYINFEAPESLKYLIISNNKTLICPPKEYQSKPTNEIVEYCNIHKVPRGFILQQRYKERWSVIRLMYIAHYKESLESGSTNFNVIPVEVITGIITRYVLT